jgi:ABC-type transport system involved in multi-copper enzyme maturation permease subunit
MLLGWPLTLFAGRLRPRLLGPLFRFEMVRASRQGRFFSLRCIYVGAMLLFLYLVYASWFGWDGSANRVRLSEPPTGAPQTNEPGLGEMAAFANAMAMTFLWVQLLAVIVLTPILTAGAISEERGRRTLDFLLVTHLLDREVVVGKLAARLGHMLLILASGLPLLAILQFLGGVDPNFVLASFICTLAFMIGFGSAGLYFSSSAPNTRQAVARTYYLALCYLLGSMICLPFGAVLDWVADGNPAAFLARESGAMHRYSLPIAVYRFVAFHAVASSICCYFAVRRLRAPLGQPSSQLLKALRTDHASSKSVPGLVESEPRHRPMPVDADNLLWWKESTYEMAPPLRKRDSLLVVLILLLTFCMSFGPLIAISVDHSPGRAAESRNLWVRSWGAFLSMLLLLGIALDAASRFSRERSRRTLDSLLATPLGNREILAAKLLGSIVVMRGWCIVVAVFWVFALLTQSISLLALPLLVGAWALYAVVVALVGIGFSLVCSNSLRATIFTLSAVASLCLVPVLLGLGVGVLTQAASWSAVKSHIASSPIFSASPPVTLWALAFPDSTLTASDGETELARDELIATCFGLAVMAWLAWCLWAQLNAKFGRITGRMPVKEGDSPNRC